MPTIVFGEGAGQIGGDHKDSWIRASDTDRCYASDIDLYVYDGPGSDNRRSLMRFSLAGHIPSNAVVSSGILTLALHAPSPGAITHGIHRLSTAWGVTPTAEGASQHPATGGQATHRRAFDFNGGGGDVSWAAGVFSGSDFGARITSWNVGNADPAGTSYNIDITSDVQTDVRDDAANHGYLLIWDAGSVNIRYASQENATVGRRPYLTVIYSVPEGAGGREGVGIDIGIGL